MPLAAALGAGGAAPEMVDLAFEVQGDTLPQGYPFALDAAVLAALPWLADEPWAGLHRIRAPLTSFGLMLSRRARLTLRLPQTRARAAAALSGTELVVGDALLRLGAASLRPVEPFPTLRAAQVASASADQGAFEAEMELALEFLGVRGRVICGRPVTLGDGERRVAGFGLVLHDLTAAHSLRIQACGIGPARRLGCGMFVHHKVIEGLGPYPD